MPTLKATITVDFDAVSGWLGDPEHQNNGLAHFSYGFMAGHVGVRRMLRLFKKLGIEEKVTWFITGHSMESFPKETAAIIATGAEIGLHGYSHEDILALTEEQERDVLEKCIDISTKLLGKTPVGFRAPFTQMRPYSVQLLEEKGFLYDSSLGAHDSQLYRLAPAGGESVKLPVYKPEVKASEWMKPNFWQDGKGKIIEIPVNFYQEDVTPMLMIPHQPGSEGFVNPRQIEDMWKERFAFLLEEMEYLAAEGEDAEHTNFMINLHPDASGLPHVYRMLERFLMWLKDQEGQTVEFVGMGELASRWQKAHPL
ncbi:hypothetical protein Sste5344_006284 [Sporothrix stenoceras]